VALGQRMDGRHERRLFVPVSDRHAQYRAASQKEMEVDLCWAYNRWVTEKVLPESKAASYTMLSLPISDPDAPLRHVEDLGDRPRLGGSWSPRAHRSRCTTTR